MEIRNHSMSVNISNIESFGNVQEMVRKPIVEELSLATSSCGMRTALNWRYRAGFALLLGILVDRTIEKVKTLDIGCRLWH
jgi:hypothetical protein